jgi:SPP1 family predicted phage head-tail adaptor
MKPTPPARMRDRVELQRPVRTQDSAGESAPTSWVTAATVWASVEPLGGGELWRAQQAQSTATVRVRTRYRPDVPLAEDWRMVEGGRAIDIQSVTDVDNRHWEWEILGSEVKQ